MSRFYAKKIRSFSILVVTPTTKQKDSISLARNSVTFRDLHSREIKGIPIVSAMQCIVIPLRSTALINALESTIDITLSFVTICDISNLLLASQFVNNK